MKLTDRDVEIMKFINDFGFCEISHIERKFQLRKPRNYKVMQRLVKAGLVIHERIFYNHCGIFYVSKRGACLTQLPCVSTIPVSIYKHQLKFILI